jgi:hypothetical protein
MPLPSVISPTDLDRYSQLALILRAYEPLDPAAFDWLAGIDAWTPPPNVDGPNAMFIERYTLAAFYFATSGNAWSNTRSVLFSKLAGIRIRRLTHLLHFLNTLLVDGCRTSLSALAGSESCAMKTSVYKKLILVSTASSFIPFLAILRSFSRVSFHAIKIFQTETCCLDSFLLRWRRLEISGDYHFVSFALVYVFALW